MKNLQDFFMKGLLQVALLLSFGFATAHGQSTYTWTSSAASGNWSVSSNWDLASIPGASDTVIIKNPTYSGTPVYIYYDSSVGSISTLNLIRDTSGVTGQDMNFVLNNSLTITSSANMYNISSSGGVYIKLANSSTLTIDTGATFTLGTSTAGVTQRIYTTINQATGYTGDGVIVKGTLIATSGSTSLWSPGEDASFTFKDGSKLQVNNEASGGIRLNFNKGFTTEGAVEIKATGAATSGSNLWLNGDVSISSGTTFSSFASGGVQIGAVSSGAVSTISFGNLYQYKFRAGSATWKLSSSAVDGSINNAIDSLYFTVNAGTSTTPVTATVQLQSNLNLASGQTNFFAVSGASGFSSGAYSTLNLDLNGFVYDETTSTAATEFIANYGTAAANQYFKFSNSGASSIANNQGIFRAPSFRFSSGGSNVLVGDNVILEATATNGVNDLGMPSALTDATTTNGISAKSTFYYSGSNTAYLKSTPGSGATEGRSIGKVVVGTALGSSSTLALQSKIIANGGLTVNQGSTFDLKGYNFVVGADGAVGASLIGVSAFGAPATIQNSSTTTASTISFASATTAGKLSPGGDGTVSNVTFDGKTSGMTLDLNNSTTMIDVENSSSYDYIILNNSMTLKFAGSTIHLNFLNTDFTNGTLTLFVGTFTSDSGAPNITSNIDGNFTFDSSTGELAFSLIPEPGTVALLLMGMAFAGTVLARRKLLA